MFNFRSILSILAFLSLTLPIVLVGAVQAGELKVFPKAVLELFTSQGCASCPEADRILDNLGKRKDIIALAYHVDYWDYIGWKDIFAHADNSSLQRNYSKSLEIAHVYTPQLIINGTYDVVGSKENEIERLIKNAKLLIPIEIGFDEKYLQISIPEDKASPEALIWLVCFSEFAEVEITKGENKGKKLTYSNIVNSRRALAMYHPTNGTTIKLPLSEIMQENDDGFAILLQEDNNGSPGRILGAASFMRESH